MSRVSQLKTLFHLTLSPIRGKTHQERLESFYRGQAEDYDAFRRRMLHGRRELIELLDLPEGGVWVDLGSGTGENPLHMGERLTQLEKAYLVDLSPSLLQVARDRAEKQGWTNVEPVLADATEFSPPAGSADLVTFSYSLTMIPDWFAAIDNAWRMLKPGGVIGVVDFFVARKYPGETHTRHRWSTRTFWPAWFAMDNVFLSSDHLPYLARRFAPLEVRQQRGKLPFVPLLRVPYYLFVGRKEANDGQDLLRSGG